MARFTGSASSVATAMVAATAKTLIQLVSVANHIVAVTGYGVSGHGVSNTQEPGLIELLTQTTAGTASALTPRKKSKRAETLLTTAQEDFTVEPTTTEVLRVHTLHPQATLDVRDGFMQELEIGGAGRLGMRATFADTQSIDSYLDFEE
jgi:hypothetical protein